MGTSIRMDPNRQRRIREFHLQSARSEDHGTSSRNAGDSTRISSRRIIGWFRLGSKSHPKGLRGARTLAPTQKRFASSLLGLFQKSPGMADVHSGNYPTTVRISSTSLFQSWPSFREEGHSRSPEESTFSERTAFGYVGDLANGTSARFWTDHAQSTQSQHPAPSGPEFQKY